MTGVLSCTYQIFKRGVLEMTEKKKKKEKSDTNKGDTNKRLEAFWYPLIVQIIVLLIVPVAAWLTGFLSLPETMTDINTRLTNLESEIKDLDIKSNFVSINKDITALGNRLSVVEGLVLNNVSFVLQPTDKAIESMKVEYASVKNEFYMSPPTWNSTDIIAKDLVSGKEYSAEELIGEKLLLPYISDGKEVYFYGQFDEKNQWDGNCLINIYANDQLALIMEAEYNHGLLIEYKQVLPAQTLSGENVWIVAERINIGDSNSGDSWNYIRDKECEKDFDFDTVTNEDIMTVQDFRSTIDTYLEGFYHGNTSNGFYNDNTGDAYLVKYNEDGTVRTLYSGMFKDGIFNDGSGNAWYIAKNENTDYMYYQGKFESGKPLHDEASYFENGLTPDRINEILQGKDFNCDLKWDFKESL